jgi:hypothetical protein
MRTIASEHRRLQGSDADETPLLLSDCLLGFKLYFDENFGALLPLEVSDSVPPTVYHESGMCALTRLCHVDGCAHREDEVADLSSSLREQEL